MFLTVTIQQKFSAAHYLPHYVGDCHNLHGHTYKVEVTVSKPYSSGSNVQDDGPCKDMVIDFRQLKDIVHKYVIDKVDHKCLNDVVENPTAESLAMWAYIQLLNAHELYEEAQLESVRIWETDNSYAEVKR